jgi:hypothetical protein
VGGITGSLVLRLDQGVAAAEGARVLELVRFTDRMQSVTVEVTCEVPVLMRGERFYAAEAVPESGFVNGRVGLMVSRGDPDDRGKRLDALTEGEAVEWPTGDRSAWLEVVPGDPAEVTVQDSPSTQITVRVPLDIATGRLKENRLRLDRVRAAVGHGSLEEPAAMG